MSFFVTNSPYQFEPPVRGAEPIDPCDDEADLGPLTGRDGVVLPAANPCGRPTSHRSIYYSFNKPAENIGHDLPPVRVGDTIVELASPRSKTQDFRNPTPKPHSYVLSEVRLRQFRWYPFHGEILRIIESGDPEALLYGRSLIEKYLKIDCENLFCEVWQKEADSPKVKRSFPFEDHLAWLTELQLKTLLRFFILYFRVEKGRIHFALSPAYLLLYRCQNYLSWQNYNDLVRLIRDVHERFIPAIDVKKHISNQNN